MNEPLDPTPDTPPGSPPRSMSAGPASAPPHPPGSHAAGGAGDSQQKQPQPSSPAKDTQAASTPQQTTEPGISESGSMPPTESDSQSGPPRLAGTDEEAAPSSLDPPEPDPEAVPASIRDLPENPGGEADRQGGEPPSTVSNASEPPPPNSASTDESSQAPDHADDQEVIVQKKNEGDNVFDLGSGSVHGGVNYFNGNVTFFQEIPNPSETYESTDQQSDSASSAADLQGELTEPLPIEDNLEYPPDDSDLQTWKASLTDQHFALLSSFDYESGKCATYSLTHEFKEQTTQQRLLRFPLAKVNGHPDVPPLPFSIDKLLTQGKDEIRGAFLVIDATDTDAQGFLDSFLRSVYSPSVFRDRLESLECFAVVQTNDGLLSSQFTSQRRQMLPYFTVPFLKMRLRAIYPDRHQELVQKIEAQIARKLWGKTESEITNQILRHIADNSLLAKIEERDTEEREKPQSLSVPGLIEESDEIRRVVLFLAAFMPGLPPRTFEQLVRKLLGNREGTEMQDHFMLTEGGDAIAQTVSKKFSLAKRWQDERHKILRDLRVQFISLRSSERDAPSPIVDFDDPRVRHELRKDFLQNHYLMFLDLLERLDVLELILRDSDDVREVGVRLLVEIMETDRSLIQVDDIVALILSIEFFYQHQKAPETRAELAIFIVKEVGRGVAYHRIYQLLRALLDSESGQDYVGRLLSRALSENLVFIVHRILQYLRYAPGFDDLIWYRQLIDRGGEKMRDRVFETLGSRIQENSGELTQILPSLGRWIPTGGVEVRRLSDQMAIDFIVGSLEGAILPIPHYARQARKLRSFFLDGLITSETQNGVIHSILAVIFHQNARRTLRDRMTYHPARVLFTWSRPFQTLALGEHAEADLNQKLWNLWHKRADEIHRDYLEERGFKKGYGLFQAVVLGDLATGLLTEHGAVGDLALEALLLRLDPDSEFFDVKLMRALLPAYWALLEDILLEVSAAYLATTPAEPSQEAHTLSHVETRRLMKQRRQSIRELRKRFRALHRSQAASR